MRMVEMTVLSMVVGVAVTGSAGCASTAARHIETAQAFRAARSSGDYDAARAMMNDDPRRWFDEIDGEGMPWSIRPGIGPWAAWDNHFRKQTEIIGWEGDDHSATLTFRETNDYFRLLERGWVTTQSVYLFDDAGRISGLLIRATGERPPGRTAAFESWATAHEPDEFAYLNPDGEIDPSGDRPQRYRALLNRWRDSAGLPRIE